MSDDLLMMLLGDARLPVAGHTQSAGLEPAVRAGLTAAEVPLYLAARLKTVLRVEAGTAVAALHLMNQGRPVDPVVRAWAARTPSPALRKASRTQARAFLRICGSLWPDSQHVADATRLVGAPRPVAVAAAAATVQLSPRSLARLIGYDDVQTVASAALKLLPLDPATTTGWVHDALPAVAALAEEVADIREATGIPALAAPQIEVWAQTHALTSRRLFSA
ncbi:urease accessory protein [Marmoricola sp. OAE513]|uniref:urease accessory protein UreF n=1 Tax=Marmoricola sp. OAE513 TaxID=2817894 RepID=UPI001AE9143F